MAKDKRIGEIPGISASAAVGLNRLGIVTIHDLLAAEFDRVAYVVDDYNEAARLLREAKKIADAGSGRRRSAHADPHVPAPLSQSPPPTTTRAHHRAGVQPHPQQPSEHHAPGTSAGPNTLGRAMEMLAHGLSLAGESGAANRAVLARRLSAAATLVDDGASEAELMSCVVLEAVEAGAVRPEEVGPRYGQTVADLVEECTALRAVPMLPTGKPPRYYMEMAREASRESRRVCAAHLLATLEAGPDSLPGGAWYAKLLLEGLEAGGPDELVGAARAALGGDKRQAA